MANPMPGSTPGRTGGPTCGPTCGQTGGDRAGERRLVFVVAGYPAIGMGHVYRAIMLAGAMSGFDTRFVLTRESEPFAHAFIAARYPVTRQEAGETLDRAVLGERPDIVVNDILNTEAPYVAELKAAGAAVVNFEDEGPGADVADLVVNALYEPRDVDPKKLCGHRYFCLRDEFLYASRNVFRQEVRRVLVTFGGTDAADFSRQTLEAIAPVCLERGIAVSVVAGPGYAHKETLAARISELDPASAHITFTHATNVMSRQMEEADLALCSAGRTVYELAHMRIPALVMAQHVREGMHTFARPRNGFLYLGVTERFRPELVRRAFCRLLGSGLRHILYKRQCGFDFSPNKARVVDSIASLRVTKKTV